MITRSPEQELMLIIRLVIQIITKIVLTGNNSDFESNHTFAFDKTMRKLE